MINMSKRIDESEITCPCRPDVTTEECEDCQDLPRGYFAERRRQAKLEDELRMGKELKEFGVFWCEKGQIYCDAWIKNNFSKGNPITGCMHMNFLLKEKKK